MKATSFRCFVSRRLLTYLLIYSMQQSPSWKANRFLVRKEIPLILGNPKVHYRIHKCPPPVPILSHVDPVHTPTSHFLKIHFNITLPSTPGSPQWSLSFRFPHQNPVYASPLTYTRYMSCPSHSFRFDYPQNSGWGVQIIKLPTSISPLLPRLSSHLYVLHVLPISFFSIWLPTKYWVRSTDHEAPHFHQSLVTSSLLSPIRTTCPAHLILFDLITHKILGEEYRSWSSPLPSVPCYLFPAMSKCSPQHPVLEHPQPTFVSRRYQSESTAIFRRERDWLQQRKLFGPNYISLTHIEWRFFVMQQSIKIFAVPPLALNYGTLVVTLVTWVEASWNVMAHAQKPDFVFQRNGRAHLNRQGGVSSVDYRQPRCAHQR